MALTALHDRADGLPVLEHVVAVNVDSVEIVWQCDDGVECIMHFAAVGQGMIEEDKKT